MYKSIPLVLCLVSTAQADYVDHIALDAGSTGLVVSSSDPPTAATWTATDTRNQQVVGIVRIPFVSLPIHPGDNENGFVIDRGDPRVDFDTLIADYSWIQTSVTLDGTILEQMRGPGFCEPIPSDFKNPVIDAIGIGTWLELPNYTTTQIDGFVSVGLQTIGTRIVVPEPSTMILLLMGAMLLIRVR